LKLTHYYQRCFVSR